MKNEFLNMINGISKNKVFLIDKVTNEEISSFEKNNNVVLPEGYKSWLKISDGGELYLPAGVQFYGVNHKPLIDVNNSDRPCDKYIVIGSLVTGDRILCEKGSEKISIYNHETGTIDNDEIFNDFETFITELKDLLGEEDD